MINEKILIFSASLFAVPLAFVGFCVGGFSGGVITFTVSLFLIKAIMRG